MKNAEQLESILAHLHLQAVLPALEDLCEHSIEIQKLLTHGNFFLRFHVLFGPETILAFQNGKIRKIENNPPFSNSLTLHFLTCSQLNKMFLKRGISIPLPSCQLWNLPKLKTFQRIASEMESSLKSSDKALEQPEMLHRYACMTLRLMVRAAVVLVEQEKKSREILQSGPSGIVQFEIANRPAGACWLEWKDDRIKMVPGFSRLTPDTSITFKNPSILRQAALNQLDSQAAIGHGDIVVKGLIPLADTVGLVLERIALYLEP